MVGIVGIRKVLKNSGNVMMNKGWIERKEDRWSREAREITTNVGMNRN